MINAAQGLSPLEQLQLIGAISKVLQIRCQHSLPPANFWHSRPVEELAQVQNKQPVTDIAELHVDFWPEEETADKVIEYIYEQRREDRLDDSDI